jgi:phosphoribosylanthranilate isomerase
MFQVKICGITTVEDALAAARAGADAIGLNFFANSPRCVTRDRAAEIIATLPAGITRVGVFVNAADEIQRLHNDLPLDLSQLHGDEPSATIADLAPRRVLRAFRCSAANVTAALEYLDRCRELGCQPAAILVDAFHPTQFGGTGQPVDIAIVSKIREHSPHLPFVLAGGLTPENVAAAIAAARPDAVDTASGVEVSPGRKDHAKMIAFVAHARAAFAQLTAS